MRSGLPLRQRQTIGQKAAGRSFGAVEQEVDRAGYSERLYLLDCVEKTLERARTRLGRAQCPDARSLHALGRTGRSDKRKAKNGKIFLKNLLKKVDEAQNAFYILQNAKCLEALDRGVIGYVF